MSAVMKSSMIGDPSTSTLGIPEGARRASEGIPRVAAPPDPEVVANARRRQFSAGEKRALLAEADRCKAAGTLGAFLRSKRIYSSMLSSWRKQMDASDRVALSPKKRGPKPDPLARQNEQLNRENARLRRQLERAEIIIDAQKKLCVALGLPTVDETSEDE
jgi:transposase